METSTAPYLRASQLLQELGIEHTLYLNEGLLHINRTSMVRFSNRKSEQAAYDEVLDFLGSEFPAYHVMWSGRSDDYIGVDFYVVKT